jgi:hypothetical protein
MKTSTPTTPAHTTPLLVLLERFLNKRSLISRAFLSALGVLLMPCVADAAMGPVGAVSDILTFLAKAFLAISTVILIVLGAILKIRNKKKNWFYWVVLILFFVVLVIFLIAFTLVFELIKGS